RRYRALRKATERRERVARHRCRRCRPPARPRSQGVRCLQGAGLRSRRRKGRDRSAQGRGGSTLEAEFSLSWRSLRATVTGRLEQTAHEARLTRTIARDGALATFVERRKIEVRSTRKKRDRLQLSKSPTPPELPS